MEQWKQNRPYGNRESSVGAVPALMQFPLTTFGISPLYIYIQRKARLENKKLQRGNDRESQGLPLSLSLMAFFLCLSLKSSSTTFETEYSAFLIPNFEMEVAEMISDMSFTFRLHLKHISREVAILAQRRESFECGQIRWRLFGKAFQECENRFHRTAMTIRNLKDFWNTLF